MRWSCRILAAFLAVASLLHATGLSAQQVVPWPVKGKLIGKKDKKSKDVSGIACAAPTGFPRQCLVIDDNLQDAQTVTLHDGYLEAGPAVPLIADSFGDKKLELDGEGVAYAKGTFYVMGSHGVPRDSKNRLDPREDRDLIAARVKAASQIVPVTIGAEGTWRAQIPILGLTKAIDAQPELRSAESRRLDDNGLTIEGVAIGDDRLFAGFRGPTLPQDRAAILAVSLKALMTEGALEPHFFRVSLGAARGIRDIAPYKDRFLLLAGPRDGGAGRYSIVLWDGKSDHGTRELFDLSAAGIEANRKAEALLFLDEDARSIRVLVMFDGEKEGAPIALTIPKP